LPRLRLWRFDGDGPGGRAGRRNQLSPSRPTAPNRTSTASLRRPPSATPTSRWSRPVRSTSTTLATGAIDAAQAAGGSRRLRPHALCQRTHSRHGARRRAGSRVSWFTARTARSRAENPLYVYGYGSYGYSLPLGFSSNRLSLLDRGVVHGLRAHSRRRRPGRALARRRQDAHQAQHLHGLSSPRSST
jgi:hypothetical protein